MREPWEWEEADLHALVEQRATEAIDLDFKACAAISLATPKSREKSKFDLSKDVSAFANSAGGTLVYGIIEDTKTHTAHKLDQGYDANDVNHEWIGQVLNSTIQPRISNVRIHPIPLSSHSPDRVAYVVHVPQGSTAHQAKDKLYYRRFNFESVSMEHYEIADVMNRAETPVLELQFSIADRERGYVELAKTSDKLCSPEMAVRLLNGGESAVAEYSQCQIFLPTYMAVDAATNFVSSGAPTFLPLSFFGSQSTLTIRDTAPQPLGYCEVRLGPDTGPTFPGERRQLLSLRFCDPRPGDLSGRNYYLAWRTRAPRSRPRDGAIIFAREGKGNRYYFEDVSLEALAEAGVVVGLAP